MSPMLETAEQGGQALGPGLHAAGALREPLPGQLMGVGSLPLRIGGSLQKKGLAEGPARCGLSGHSAGHPGMSQERLQLLQVVTHLSSATTKHQRQAPLPCSSDKLRACHSPTIHQPHDDIECTPAAGDSSRALCSSIGAQPPKGELKLTGFWSLKKAVLNWGAILCSCPEDEAPPEQQLLPAPCAITLLYEMDLLGGGWQNGDEGTVDACTAKTIFCTWSSVHLLPKVPVAHKHEPPCPIMKPTLS